jgi:glycosyltransferase involved in cell wall biosynthesis
MIAARNAEPYLGEAINSVLAQTLPPEEVIVVDDGSTDGTAVVAEGYGDPVHCVRQSPSGLGAALNRGLEHAHGDFMAWVDADDLWLPEKQALQMRALTEDAQLDLVFGHVRHFHSPELTAGERSSIALPEGLRAGISRGAMLIRREALERVGRFDTRWTLGDFLDWYARAVDAGLRSAVLPEVVLSRRLHSDNSGIRERDSRSDYARALKVVLDRRRARAEGRTRPAAG